MLAFLAQQCLSHLAGHSRCVYSLVSLHKSTYMPLANELLVLLCTQYRYKYTEGYKYTCMYSLTSWFKSEKTGARQIFIRPLIFTSCQRLTSGGLIALSWLSFQNWDVLTALILHFSIRKNEVILIRFNFSWNKRIHSDGGEGAYLRVCLFSLIILFSIFIGRYGICQ